MGDKVGHANFRGRSTICTRPRMEKQWENGTKQVKTGKNSTSGYPAKLNFELDRCIGDKVGHASFRDRSAICTRLRMEKQCENGTKHVKTGKNSTSGYAAKLNFEFDSGIGDKVGHASFRGRSAICTRPRVEKQ